MAATKLPEWDLSDLYPARDAKELARDIDKLNKKVTAFAAAYLQGKSGLTAANFGQSLKEYEAIESLMGRLSSFADLEYAGNMADAARARFYQNIKEQLTAMASQLVSYTLIINALSAKHYKEWLSASKEAAHYEPWLRRVRAFAPYQLSDEMEKLLVEKQLTSQSWVRLFDETISRMRFTVGKKQLSSAEIFDLMSHKDGEIRQSAAKAIGVSFQAQAELFALITNTLAKDKAVEDKWRGFARPISSRNVSNDVEDKVVEALISTVKANYQPLAHRYYQWKAKQFGKRQMPYWDRNAPLPGASDRKIPWSEAQQVVLSAYQAFSPNIANIGQQFFDKNWIDVPPRPGKSPGAFAHPTVPQVHPYLLLNYQGKTRDVMTLAHELGHGVHQVLAAKQGTLMSDTPLTLAETASVFGEMLTFQELLRREKNLKKRQYLIAGKIEDMLNTVVRQIAFCEFEIRLHDARAMGELSVDDIGKIWLNVQSESLGPAIKLSPEYACFWMYIPHFIHSPFYVYAYAFGDCLVNSLYAVYQQESAKGEVAARAFAKKYEAMLSAGGTLGHKDLLKPFGLDASKPDFWQQGLNMIADYIEQLD